MDSTDEPSLRRGEITPLSISDTHCGVCANLVSIFREPWRAIKLGKIGQLLDSPCSKHGWLQDIEWNLGEVPQYRDREITAYKFPSHTTINFELDAPGAEAVSKEYSLVFRPEIPQHHGTVRILDKKWIDMGIMREWLGRCNCEHGPTCDQMAFPNLRPFSPQWLIDVTQCCIVPCTEDHPRFLTLSYTWGRTRNFRTTFASLRDVQKPGALHSGPIAEQIPRTIREAIQLTKALGETKLWCDSLCIIQDDAEALSYHLQNMHNLYATSFLTIIVADGLNAEHGLHGALESVSPARCTPQVVVALAGGESMVTRTEPNDHPLGYHTRMWTFQERVFAKRRLKFDAGTVEWQCGCASWTEQQLYPSLPEDLLYAPPEAFFGKLVSPRIPLLGTLGRLVREFNKTNLGFDEDVFSAFMGIHSHLQTRFPSGLVFGHPELFFDISLCWSSCDPSRFQLQRRRTSSSFRGDPMLNRLPSWSWMGWHRAISFPRDAECYGHYDYMGFTDVVTKWYAIEHPGSSTKHAIHTRWHLLRQAGLSQTVLEGWKCEEFQPPLDGSTYHSFDKPWPFSMPKELPTHIYTHDAPMVEWKDNRKQICWYPIPCHDDTAYAPKQIPSHCGYEYLQCTTTRMYAHGSDEWMFLDRAGGVRTYFLLKDADAKTIGGLNLCNEEQAREFRSEGLKELIAVAKGWSSVLQVFDTGDSLLSGRSGDRVAVTDGKQEGVQRNDESAPETIPWMELWECERAKKEDCFHVLWIEWENGVAYRKSAGFVLVDDWDRLADLDQIDIVLG